jgi:hypothetical protein
MQLPLVMVVQEEHQLMAVSETMMHNLVEILVGKDQSLPMVAVRAVLFLITLVMVVQVVVGLTFHPLLVAQIKDIIQDGLHTEQMVLVVQMAHD